MTEQEAQTLVDRIPRIWEPYAIRFGGREGKELPLRFDFALDAHWMLTYIVFEDSAFPYVVLEYNSFDSPFELEYQPQDGIHCVWDESYCNDKSLVRQLIQEWIPIFRRGCWLSGCAVEASAHEKAEWMQGFSSKEIEEWNLTF